MDNTWQHDSAEDCFKSLGERTHLKNRGVPQCNSTWDAILCWPAAAAGTVISQPCPPIRGVDPMKFSHRECLSNGTWAGVSDRLPTGYTNYTECYTDESRDIYMMIFNSTSSSLMKMIARGSRFVEVVGLSVSFLSLIVSLFIFCHFRNLRCDRTRVHRNLFIAILFHDAILLVVYIDQMVAFSSGHHLVAGSIASAPRTIYTTPAACELLCVLVEYTRTVTFMWMLTEGVYLHNTIVCAIYPSNPNYVVFYLLGWGLALIPTAVWAGLNLHKNSNRCWFMYQFRHYYWIVEGPRIAVICINSCLLFGIVRELIKKLKANHLSDACKAWKAARATLILLPLLGISNILSMTQATIDRPIKFALWSFSAVFFSSFQGFFISLLYCFINGEVMSTLSFHWKRDNLSKAAVSRDTDQSPSTTPAEKSASPASSATQKTNV